MIIKIEKQSMTLREFLERVRAAKKTDKTLSETLKMLAK